MPMLKVLIWELLSVNRFSACSIASCEVTALCHETWDDAMEERACKVELFARLAYSFLTCAESTEVF